MFVRKNAGIPAMPEFAELPPIANAALSVVLLADDDAAHLEKVVADWVTYLNGLDREYEILLVDDGSTDDTAKQTAALTERFRRVRVLRHPAREGEGRALRTGLAAARYPLVCYARCDPRFLPADLRKMLTQIDKVHLIGTCRAGRPVPLFWRVCGTTLRLLGRIVLNHAEEPLPGWLGWKRHAGRLLARLVFGVRNPDVGCPYRLLRREILPRMPLQSRGPFVHVEILAKATFLGRYLGEDVPLGDRARPFVFQERDEQGGGVFADAWRLFQKPDFGPPRLAVEQSKAAAVVT
jgi:glycosyltransferase involved in cell wall biosynthesis